jgi:hypothetical protein
MVSPLQPPAAEVLMKRSLTGIVIVGMFAAACGGSPTSPQTITAKAAVQPDVANNPAPTPPSPEPPTPSPAPAPPAPAPPTDSVETWHATVDVQRASPGHALPSTFDVTVRGDQMEFGPLEVTILVRQDTHIYARKGQEITIQIDDEKWTVTSVDVFATGTISYTSQ